MQRFTAALIVCAALALSAQAHAQVAQGYIAADTTLWSGPSPDYPPITNLPPQTWVSVQGCTAGWQWCDVITGPNRGWVPGNYILYPNQGIGVPLPSYGASIGVPIVTFVIGTYWGAHYRNRSFYGNRNYWYGRPIHARPMPPPHRPPAGWGRPPQRPGPGARPPHSRPPSHTGNRPPHGNHPRPPANPGSRPQGNNQRPPARPGNRPQGNNQRPPANTGSRPHGNNQRPPANAGNRPVQGNGKPPAKNQAPAKKGKRPASSSNRGG